MLHDKTNRRDFLKVGGATAASASLVSLESIAATLFNTFFGSSQQVVAKSMGSSLGFGSQSYSSQASPYLEAIVDNTKDVYMIPQFVVGGNDALRWTTRFILANKSGKDINAIIQTYDQSGNPLSVEMSDGINGNSITLSNFKSGSLYNNSTKPNGNGVVIGYAILTVDKGAKVDFGVEYDALHPFTGELLSRVAVPSMMIDNVFSSAAFKKGQKNTGVAIANPNSFPIALYLDFRNTSSNLVSESHLQLNPGQQLPRFITELPGVNLPPDFEGTITVYSKDRFGATTLTLEKEVVSSVPVSNNYHPVKQFKGKLTDLEGKPVGSQLVTLTDSNYKNPATGQTESLAYKTFTDENGNFNIGLLRDFSGNLEMKVESSYFYNYKRPISFASGNADVGEVQTIPRFTNEKGEDGLQFAKFLLGLDGTGATTVYGGWTTWPVPTVYNQMGTAEQWDSFKRELKLSEGIANLVARDTAMTEVTQFPTVNLPAGQYIDKDGKPISGQTEYGIVVEPRTAGGYQVEPLIYHKDNFQLVKIRVWVGFGAASGAGHDRSYLHELIAHALAGGWGGHTTGEDDISSPGRKTALPSLKERWFIDTVRHLKSTTNLGYYYK